MLSIAQEQTLYSELVQHKDILMNIYSILKSWYAYSYSWYSFTIHGPGGNLGHIFATLRTLEIVKLINC